jgi:hypothetical protein
METLCLNFFTKDSRQRQRRFNKDHCTSSVQLSLDEGLAAVISPSQVEVISAALLLLSLTSLTRHSRFNHDLCISHVQLPAIPTTKFLNTQ